MMLKKKFRIRYECVSKLHDFELWPDGDAPDNPTTADVRRLVGECGGIYSVLGEWNLHEHDGDWFVEEIDE